MIYLQKAMPVAEHSEKILMLDRTVERDDGRATPAVMNMVESCAYLLSAAAGADSKDAAAKLARDATKALNAALDSPEVVAAFGDVFSHPQIVASRIESLTIKDLERASDEVFGVVYALRDQHQAAELRKVLDGLHRLEGPSPWDTFFMAADAPDQALMPLYGSRTSDVLGLGPIGGGERQRSAGEQALFYPVGGYERYAEAASVVVAQNLADGLAINEALKDEANCAVVVASSPEALADVVKDVRWSLVNRAAIAGPGDREAPAVIASISLEGDSADVRSMVRGSPENGVGVVRPGIGPAHTTASWSDLELEAISAAVAEARQASMRRLEKLAQADDRLDVGGGLRESVRELREAVRETARAHTLDEPKVEKALSRAAGRGR